MANSKLLKEAIADAKAVKETALANAKLALEEAFTPRLQSILTQKLRQEAEEETGDDEMQNEELDSSDIGTGDTMGKTPGKTPALDADTDLSVGVKKSTAKKGLEDPNRTIVNDLMEGDEDEMGGDTDKEIAELRARLAELEGDEEKETEEESAWNEGDDMDMDMDSDSDEDGEDYEITGDEEEETEEDDDDDMDLESIIRELEAQLGEEESSDDEMTDEDYAENQGAENGMVSTGTGTNPNHNPNNVKEAEEGMEDKEATDEVIDLEEILREMEADMKGEEYADGSAAGTDKSGETEKALEEAYSTIKSLQATINEVNLLNAKLLFANKLFRAHNMTNEQKVKVIETLDRTKSVREVKLVYATLAENLKPTPTNKTAKKSITEGIASKVVKSTKPASTVQKQVIAESANFADRFKKLAGIIK